MKIGTIHPKTKLFMRESVGNAQDDEKGITYELNTNFGNGIPIVRSSKTGKHFTLSWEDIIDLAVKAGIDEE